MMNTETSPDRSRRLFLELGTTLLLEPIQQEDSFSCELTGMQVGKYLIAQIPSKDLGRFHMTTGDELHVKYVLAREVFGFKTHIIQRIEEPEALVFMAYPEKIQNEDIRRGERTDCFLPVRLEIKGEMVRGHMVNINSTGCLCQTAPKTLPESPRGMELILHLSYGQFETLAIQGEVRSCRTEDQHQAIGILFESLDGFSQKILSTLVPSLSV